MSDTLPTVPPNQIDPTADVRAPVLPPLVAGGLFVDPNWTPRLADRLGSVRTDMGGVHEHWPQDLAPVFYPHIPNGFWRAAGAGLATSADAGAPGDFQPSGCLTPTSLADMAGVTANPQTAWASDQYMVLDDEVTTVTWDGTAWVPWPIVVPVLPTISTIAPATGSTAGGEALVISGGNFVAGMTADLGGTPISGTYINPMRFEGTAPPGTAGPVDVTVTTPGGTATLPGGYTYTTTTDDPSSRSEPPSDPGVAQVAQDIQENAQAIGEAAQNIGEAAQALAQPSGTGPPPSATSEAPSGFTGTTEAPETGQEPDMTEYEMDQMWGIGAEAEPASES